ncbi:hypothetical protein [uncultured Tessaracoccus sp.]|uniref:hypothetical protein n=1 Tax=uncultured Tessaracoccus sp. TaxID=905023 RepID=UPI00261C78AF|nr:hypothetical protein [uncultured Tessaracoccus sp.]
MVVRIIVVAGALALTLAAGSSVELLVVPVPWVLAVIALGWWLGSGNPTRRQAWAATALSALLPGIAAFALWLWTALNDPYAPEPALLGILARVGAGAALALLGFGFLRRFETRAHRPTPQVANR